MSKRKTILATGEIYHVYNRGVEKRKIFLRRREYLRFMELISYYRFENCPVKYSYFSKMSIIEQNNILTDLEMQSKKLVEIVTYCLMPNHFHFLLRQETENGVSKFMEKISKGYSHYFNISHKRVGPLFQSNFQAVRIESNEQLLHAHRYIHLNPVTAYLIELPALASYSYSSYPEYIRVRDGFTNTKQVLSYFKNIDSYKTFIADQADYARQLDSIKHLLYEYTPDRYS